ncbi:MAG: S-layer homology domain-containing protein [Clostridia bacterium]|nr:S-layer homology domain-containing protein [Clostridia bacterium]
MRNLKKVVALVAVFAMMVSTVAFAQTYSDVVETDVYAEAVETLSALGIFTGDDADNDGVMDFRPADTITRAEVAAIVCRIQNLNIVGAGSTPFVDVPSSHWASGYVAQAAGQGIINGYGDGNFGPDDNVTYEQVVKMLMETLGYNLFANSNGGYPSGYLAAAQRWEVLDGVVGGAVGAEASRGMVAQLVNNAIDTPLMQQTVWGSDNNWEVLDGGLLAGGVGNRQFSTLLKRDLKVYKASGVVVANSYADLSAGSNYLNTDDKKTVKVQYDANEVNTNYGFAALANPVTFYQGEVDADAFLGKAVTLYAAQKLDGSFELVTLAKATGLNKEVSFGIDLYDGITTNAGTTTTYDLAYLTSEASTNAIKARVEGGAPIILNGSAAGNGALTNFFSNSAVNTGLIDPCDAEDYSGKVTLVNFDDDNAYDLVSIEIGTSAVVKGVAANGQLTLMSSVTVPIVSGGVLARTQNLATLNFENDDTSYLVNLTKNGEAIDYTELNKWDVITIVNGDITGPTNGCDVYNVSVLADESTVDGYVAAINTKGQIKLNDGNWYTYSSTGYGLRNMKNGVSGRFYIDAYGKIVALDDEVEVEGVEVSVADNYAVVLQAMSKVDGFGGNVILQLLTKEGEIVEKKLASTVSLKNYAGHVADLVPAAGTTPASSATINALAGGSAPSDLNDFAFKLADIFTTSGTTTTADAECATLVGDLAGKMVSITENSAGAIKVITMTQTASDEEDMYLAANSGTSSIAYDDEDMKFANGVQIDEDTLVFYVTDAATTGSLTGYGDTSSAAADYSVIGTGADLAKNSTGYKMAAFDDGDDIAKAIIVYNTTGAIKPSSNVAVIASVATTVANGVDVVYEISYYQNGELKTAVTRTDLDTGAANDLSNATLGDVYTLNVSNGIISAASKVMDYNTNRQIVKSGSPVSVTAGWATNGVGLITNVNDVTTMFGTLNGVSARGNLNLSTGDSISAKDLDAANVYVVDPNKKDLAQLFVGSAGNAFVDENLVLAKLPSGVTTRTLDVKWKNDSTPTQIVVNGSNENVLLSQVFAYEYDGDVIDVVIYLPFSFNYTFTDI